MKNRLKRGPLSSAILCAAFVLGPVSFAQNTSGGGQSTSPQTQSQPGNPAQNPQSMPSQNPQSTMPSQSPSGSQTQPAASGQETQGTTQTTQTKKTTTGGGGGDEFPDLVEIDPFGGVSTFGQINRGLTTHLVTGGIGGLRVGVNPSRYIGIEGFFEYVQANVEFRSSSGINPSTGTALPAYSFGAHNYEFGVGPVVNFTPRGSRVQPYVTVGVAGIQFTPTDTAKGIARLPAVNALYGSQSLNDNLQVGVYYGGGVKFHLTDHFGLRIDGRGVTSRGPTYGLPNFATGGIYIPRGDKLNNFQGTVGLVVYLGQSKCPPMPEPPTIAAIAQPTISGTDATACQGKPFTVHANVQSQGNQKLSYSWTLNGQQQGSDSPDFTFTPNNSGTFNIQVTVKDTEQLPTMEKPKKFPQRCWNPPTIQAPQPVTASGSVTVNDSAPTISNVAANPSTLACAANANGTHTAQLSATVTPSACGGTPTYKWTVSEGSVTNDTSANATFDASSLNFENGATAQTKTVTATLTVTGEDGKTATQTTQVTVNCEPQFVRLDDVIFAKNNARVNNCGKRLLIDDAASRLSSGDYDIVLVGHRDNDERERVAAAARRGRRAAAQARALDEQRVLNAAGVLSGGTGTCAKIDPSRIKVDFVGTDQTSETRPGQCGTSNIKERKGSRVTDADKNRRVEVYLVPRNSQSMPPAVKNAQPLSPDTMKAIGCPK